MHSSIVERELTCPFCGESIAVLLDLSAGSQSYIEDCQVCCRPMQVSFVVDEREDVDLQVDCAS